MASDLEKEYDNLAKKYLNLPNYQNIDKEFEIELNIGEKVIPKKFTLRAIANTTSNYMHFFIDYLHNLIYPNPGSLIIMEESKIFTNEEKKEIESILKKILFLTRKNLEIVLLKSEKEDADFIAFAFKEWKLIKRQILPLIQKAKDHWK